MRFSPCNPVRPRACSNPLRFCEPPDIRLVPAEYIASDQIHVHEGSRPRQKALRPSKPSGLNSMYRWEVWSRLEINCWSTGSLNFSWPEMMVDRAPLNIRAGVMQNRGANIGVELRGAVKPRVTVRAFPRNLSGGLESRIMRDRGHRRCSTFIFLPPQTPRLKKVFKSKVSNRQGADF